MHSLTSTLFWVLNSPAFVSHLTEPCDLIVAFSSANFVLSKDCDWPLSNSATTFFRTPRTQTFNKISPLISVPFSLLMIMVLNDSCESCDHNDSSSLSCTTSLSLLSSKKSRFTFLFNIELLLAVTTLLLVLPVIRAIVPLMIVTRFSARVFILASLVTLVVV